MRRNLQEPLKTYAFKIQKSRPFDGVPHIRALCNAVAYNQKGICLEKSLREVRPTFKLSHILIPEKPEDLKIRYN